VVRILGVPVYDQPLARALDEIVATCTAGASPRTSRLISATGAHGLVHAQHDPAFARALEQFAINLPDGLPGVWIGKYFKRARSMERVRGPDFFRAVMQRTTSTPIQHFLCGGKPGVANALRAACRDRFGNTRVVGTYTPPFRALTDAEWDELARQIYACATDIVWIGLSTPKQELFAVELARRVRVHYVATVGAAFDFHTGTAREAPVFVQKSGLEWFYRLLQDPKRLTRRYAEVVPLFLYYNLLDLVRDERQR